MKSILVRFNFGKVRYAICNINLSNEDALIELGIFKKEFPDLQFVIKDTTEFDIKLFHKQETQHLLNKLFD
ncbi:MAG: hypothetical protein ABIP51_15030 [Bacteroidia bacterium]